MGQTVQSREGSQRILPQALREGQNSVFDNPLENALQAIFSLLGGNDPTSQVLGLMNPMETGPMGGAAKAIGRLFDRYRSVTQLPSRLESAVVKLPDNRPIPPGQVVSQVKKAGTTDDELAYRLGEFLQTRGTKPVTKAEIEAQLAARPISPQVTVRGGKDAWSPELERAWDNREFGTLGSRPSTPNEWIEASGRLERVGQQWQRNGDAAKAQKYFALSEEANRHAEGLSAGGSTAGQPKFSRYQVPGGEDYRETLITLPEQAPQPLPEGYSIQPLAGHRSAQFTLVGPDGFGHAIHATTPEQAHAGALNRLQDQGVIPQPKNFHSSHFDDPNILVHTRSNVRELPEVGKGTFLEEVQSDWHQQGKRLGYGQAPQSDTDRLYAELGGEAHANVRGVPDAPYKDTWQDLALKHHLLEAANDPQTQWLGFTGGQTQAARYDLSKQIDSLAASRTNTGEYSIQAFLPSPGGSMTGRPVFEGANRLVVSEDKLADYVGKDMARKIVAEAPGPGQGEKFWSGLDLQVGGEGMHAFYDQLLPARLRKLLKPFGGTVERGAIPKAGAHLDMSYQGSGVPPVVPDAPEPMWLARLTPEMKDRIAREGFPALMALIAAGEIMKPSDEELFQAQQSLQLNR